MKVAVKIPNSMNVGTATNERIENRGKPHTPWPLVQPPPHLTPRPTMKAPKAMRPKSKGSEESRTLLPYRDSPFVLYRRSTIVTSPTRKQRRDLCKGEEGLDIEVNR